jgi:hypothetical protein
LGIETENMPVERLHRYLPWALVERMKFWIISSSYSRKNHLIIPKEFLRNLYRVIRWFKSFGSHRVQKGKEGSVLYSRHSDEAREAVLTSGVLYTFRTIRE